VVEDYAAVNRLVARTHWLTNLRWLAAAGVIATVLGSQWAFGIRLNVVPVFGVTGILLFYNLIFHYHAGRLEARLKDGVSWREVNHFANLQISADLIVLMLLLHYSGGVENPLSSFFIFHMIIASILLSSAATYLQATLATGLFAAMAIVEWRWPAFHHHVQGFLSVELLSDGKFVLASVATLGATVYLTVYLTASIARELRRREAQLVEARDHQEAANDRLHDLEARKSRFMRVAAHQLRAPLGAIQSSLRVVLDGYARQDPEKEREMIARSVSRTESMLSLLNDLLALSRAKESHLEEKGWTRFNLRGIIEKVCALYKPRAGEKGVVLQMGPLAETDRIEADREAIEDVVSNLLSNAIKYTGKGGTVTVASFREGDFIEVQVRDTGIGIPAGEIKDLFTEFYRASNAREVEREGTGLGLSIASEIVKRHGGDISVRSEVGQGSSFSFKLPLAGEQHGS